MALAAVDAGATDLLLRDWDTESIGALRDALPAGALVERVDGRRFPDILTEDVFELETSSRTR